MWLVYSLKFYNFPEANKRRLSSINMLERTNGEIRKRSRAVGVFPRVGSYLRLIAPYLIEHTENRANKYANIRPERFNQVLESSLAQNAN